MCGTPWYATFFLGYKTGKRIPHALGELSRSGRPYTSGSFIQYPKIKPYLQVNGRQLGEPILPKQGSQKVSSGRRDGTRNSPSLQEEEYARVHAGVTFAIEGPGSLVQVSDRLVLFF